MATGIQNPFGFGAGAQDNAVSRQGSTHPERLNIWRADLESIRREKPLIDTKTIVPQRVGYQGPPAPGQGAAGSFSQGNTTVTSAGQAGPEVIDLDDDAGDQGVSPEAATMAFYGQQGAKKEEFDQMTQYQDHNQARQGRYPSRKNGLGFNMKWLREDKNWAEPVSSLQDVQPTWDGDMYMTNPPLGFDEAVSRNWVQDSFENSLLYGFPLVEGVVFYRPRNYAGARSACFFKALAYHVYGDHTFYLRVQAEHLQYYGDVLEWEDHPRHQLYTRMNQKFYDTTISTTDRRNPAPDTEVDTVANFFQLLSIPQIWMPLDMLDVTADLYNLFIVVYTIRNDPLVVTEVSTKGSYNARHVFLLFNGVHYQPMVPNEYLASEFTFPRVTYENVKSLPSSGNTDQGKSSVDLRWRNTWGQGLDRRKGALPVDHVFYRETLRTAMTGSYPEQ